MTNPSPATHSTFDQVPPPATAPVPDPAQAQADAMQRATDMVAEMRAAGHPRQAIVQHLSTGNVSPTTTEYLINQADLFAGMMGRPHPADIDPNVKAQIESNGTMMIGQSFDELNGAGTEEIKREQTLARAKEMAEAGKGRDSLIMFLTSNGCPDSEATAIASQLVAAQTETDEPKKRRGLFRR